MIILHIANLTDVKYKGPNVNVPKNIIYGSKYANMALYNLQDSKLAVDVPKEKRFGIRDYKRVSDLPKPFNEPDIVVFHGVYYLKYCKIAAELRKKKIPYIIVPRCSMTTAGIKSHYLKKKIANLFLFNKFIAGAEEIQFLTKNEYLESKDNFIFNNYYILGNGVEIPEKHYTVKKRREFKVVFVGRYNIYHKGLDMLLESVKKYADWFRNSNVAIELYGSDSDNGLAYLNKTIKNNSLGDIVSIKGPAYGRKKEEVILDADVFIHTSRLEGQPTAVIEAISYGVPVIVTPGTNVADIVTQNKLGYAIDFDTDSLYMCLSKIICNKKCLGYISSNEVIYAQNNFSWDNIMIQSVNNYSEII